MKRIKKNKGFTSIELLIVVSIISVLSGVVYFVYDSVSDKRQVNSELKNIEVLVGQLRDATISSTYHNISNETLLNYGVNYHSNFSSFTINGTSEKSFEIGYKDLNSRQCSDFALKTSGFKGEYILTRKVNGKVINNSPTTIASECAKDLNTVNLEFEGLVLHQVTQITPGTPKPSPVYAEAGSFIPDLPDRGDVPTTLANSTRTVSTPIIPVKGAYVPPVGVTSNPSVVVGGDIFDTSGYVKPVYNDTPPPPVTSGEDDTNIRPSIPAVPPPPAPPVLEWTQGYPLNKLVYLRDYRGGSYSHTLVTDGTDGDKAKFEREFNMNLNPNGGYANAVMVTINKERFDEMSKNGYHFYLIRYQMVGPANWEQFRGTFIVCKEPKKGYRDIGCK